MSLYVSKENQGSRYNEGCSSADLKIRRFLWINKLGPKSSQGSLILKEGGRRGGRSAVIWAGPHQPLLALKMEGGDEPENVGTLYGGKGKKMGSLSMPLERNTI